MIEQDLPECDCYLFAKARHKVKKKKSQTYYLENSVDIRKVIYFSPYANIFIFDMLEDENCSL